MGEGPDRTSKILLEEHIIDCLTMMEENTPTPDGL
jgi:hypothetical protein